MKFYVFDEGFGVMAESEEEARAAAREQWRIHFCGTFDSRPQPILQVVEANTLIPFFC